MNLLLFFTLCIIYIIFVEGVIKRGLYYTGDYTLVLLFNNETITTDKILFTKYDGVTKTLYFQTVYPDSKCDFVLCRISSQRQVITGWNGCSNIANPEFAFQSANCIVDEVNVKLLRQIFAKTWYLDKNSQECYIQGGKGDVRLCAGPLRLSRDNHDSFQPYQRYTSLDLMSSRFQFLDCLTGPFAMSPCLVRIKMVLPSWQVNSNCIDPDLLITYADSYSNIETDNYRFMITAVWKDFKGNSKNDLRLILKRFDEYSTSFRIVFGNTLAPDGGFNFNFYSQEIVSSLNYSQRVFIDWVHAIELGKNYTFTLEDGTSPCWGIITLNEIDEYTYIPPYPVTAFNYSYNVNPKVYDTTAVCDACFGRLDQNGNPVCPDTPEGAMKGGSVRYVYPGNIYLPIFVPPNPNLQYRFDCNEVYPKGPTFFDINGVQRARINLEQQRCFSPFLSDELILANTRPDEKFIQCQLLGGYTWGRAVTNCAFDITSVKCQLGWYYYADKCFYKFDPSTEGKYASPLDQADIICSQLNSYAQPLIEIDYYLDKWLYKWYIYQDPNPNVDANYRVPVFGASYCSCYKTGTYTQIQCPCYNIKDDEDLFIFPVCFYYTSVAELEPLYADIVVSLETAVLWQQGQEGPPPNGLEAICSCFIGSDGKICDRTTCPLTTVVLESNITDNSLIVFFKKCYNKGRGSCYNGQSRVCQCNPFYGPSASVLPQYTELYQFVDIPCACPAGVATRGIFEINGVIYNSSSLYLPCSGIDHGSCIVPNNTNTGYCVCTTRPNLFLGIDEPAYDGPDCASPTPIQPWKSDVKNGLIATEFCNHQGITCPSGVDWVNRFIGNVDNQKCYDKATGEAKQGCVCNNGKGGPCCTCVVPFNYALDLRFQEFNNGFLYFIDMGIKVFGKYIMLKNCESDETTQVYLSNEVGKSESSFECLWNGTFQYYYCDTPLSYQFVAISNIAIAVCDVIVQNQFFNYCGQNHTVNQFAGRVFDNSDYRGPNLNLDNQFAGVANFGCTNTECMCNSNYGGAQCGAGVSSYRYVATSEGEILSKKFCGETVDNPDFDNSVRGRGFLDSNNKNCSCNTISNVDLSGSSGFTQQYFVGDACSCVNIYNKEWGEILSCAGHGICQNPKFPMGKCQVDIDKFDEDSLSQPFNFKTTKSYTVTKAITTSDLYMLKVNTDSSGTSFPSQTPTQSPTGTNKFLLYDSGYVGKGNMGDVATTNAICAARMSSIGATCRVAVSFLEYSYRRFSSYSSLYGFDPDIPIYAGATGVYLGTWSSSIGGSISTTLKNAGVYTGTKNTYWTGYDDSGLICLDWTDSRAGSAVVGALNNADKWLDNLFDANCDTSLLPFLCGCIVNTVSPTKSPTKSPTVPSKSPTTATPVVVPTTQQPSNVPTTATPTIKPTTKTPTQVPTTISPTKTPTRTPDFTVSPTIATPVIRFYNEGTLRTGNLGSYTTTDAQCATKMNTLGVSCREVASFLTYPGVREIDDIPLLLGFPTSAPVVAGLTGTSLGNWNTILAGSVSTTLRSAGVFPAPETNYWNGYTGDAALTCDSWTLTGLFDSGITGDTTSLSQWVFSLDISCSEQLYYGCICVQGTPPPNSSPSTAPTTSIPSTAPTQAPTQVPTTANPTTSPTKNPTLTPATISPSKTPTKTPTLPPTKTPTLSPTPRGPTKSPSIPTHSPSITPTTDYFFNRPLSYIYKLPIGSDITLLQTLYNGSFDQTLSSPTKLKISSLKNSFIPILWTDLEYRVWNYITNTTQTATIDFCNPGNPSWIPGTPFLQSDGFYACPTINKCILTNDCTDSLAPDINYQNFPDLRSCWCSHGETTYPSVTSLQSNTYHELFTFNGSFGLTSPPQPPSDNYGVIYCNNFIDRTVNCMLLRQNSNYPFQCVNEPIGCYDGTTIGYFFGALGAQNPKYIYDINQTKWTEGLYHGLSTIMNGKKYLKNGKYADPFTSELLNQYYWVYDNASTFGVYTAKATPIFSSYQADLIQGAPYMYEPYDFPPPPLNPEEPQYPTTEMIDCANSLKTTPDITLCNYIFWANTTFNSLEFRRVGLEYAFVPPIDRLVLSFEIRFKTNKGQKYFTGVEIYDQWGEKCGGVYNSSGFNANTNYTVICSNNAKSRTPRTTSVYSIKLLGQNNIYDLPGMTLNDRYFVPPNDELKYALNMLYFTPFIGYTYPLMYAIGYDTNTILSYNQWPQRQFLNSTFFNAMPFDLYYNYTEGSFTDDVSYAWKTIADNILDYNTFPINYPLLIRAADFETQDLNISDPYDQEYLYGIWATWFAPYYCGGEQFQCRTLQDLGECVIETDYDLRWRNIGSDADYIFKGDEGGCDCYHTYEQGFYNYPLFCLTCENGYGPSSLEEFGGILQYSYLINPTYEFGFFPFSDDGITLEEFEQSYSCRYPVYYDSVVSSFQSPNICSGHGVMQGYSDRIIINTTIWNERYFTSCSSLSFESDNFELFENTSSLYSLIYLNMEGDYFAIIGDNINYEIIYVTNTTVFTCLPISISDDTYPKPFGMDIICTSNSDENDQIEFSFICQHDIFFQPESLNFNFNIHYLKNPFILTKLI